MHQNVLGVGIEHLEPKIDRVRRIEDTYLCFFRGPRSFHRCVLCEAGQNRSLRPLSFVQARID